MMYLRLFFEFFKIGLFAVGGGMATLPFLYDMADRFGWFTAAQLADMIAVSESTPGPIGVNMATYVGFHCGAVNGVAGSLFGAAVSTLGLITPSIIVILIVARVLKAFRDNAYVDAAFYGLRPCSVGLIAAAGILVVKVALLNTDAYTQSGTLLSLVNWKAVLLAVIVLFFTRWKKTKGLHPVVFLACSAVIGVIFAF